MANSGRTGRRQFLRQSLAWSAGSLVAGPSLTGQPSPRTAASRGPALPGALPDAPTRVLIDHDGTGLITANRSGSRYSSGQGVVELAEEDGGIAVRVHSPRAPLTRVVLRWELRRPETTLYLGDHWERGYGDLQWRSLQPERVMPWYSVAHDPAGGRTFLVGVKTQPGAFCFWMSDAAGIALWLDFRNGGSPCLPGERTIGAATIVSAASAETPLAALTQFCRRLCPRPRLAAAPICGSNNWYYTYGKNFDAGTMRRDADFLAELAAGHAHRSYCVIDAGWNADGAWSAGDPARFPDMPGLAADMKQRGVRPGIWMRLAARPTVDDPQRLRPGPTTERQKPLDLTLPENLALIRDDVARVRAWGYELVKHDFSTFDALGRWGYQMGADITTDAWHFADRSLTNAEIILGFYRTLREAAGDGVLLGCNTIGHLGAGLFEIQRTGDDTSGRAWERTRRMGINTLAFRLPQHGTFFASDPDCVAHTEKTPWEFDRQFLDLVAKSGTALFVSTDPSKLDAEKKRAFRDAMQVALAGGAKGGCEPLDWLHTTTPRRWRLGGEEVVYHWEEAAGASPFRA